MSMSMSALGFYGMTLIFKVRDFILPRKEILQEVGIQLGYRVLDYGCGPGGYVADTAELVGQSGKVYALDIDPLAVQHVQSVVQKRGLANVEIIHSGCETGLPDDSVDVVLLYDIFHALDDPQAILAELHRVLKKEGTLSFSDHHLDDGVIVSGVTDGQLFELVRRDEHTYRFSPRVNGGLQ